MREYVIDFDRLDRTSLPRVGGKNANLGEMLKAGIRVPPGFAVTTDSYLDFLRKAGLAEEILELLNRVDPAEVASVEDIGARIRRLIESAPIPPEVEEMIKESYVSLCDRCGAREVPVAVRSSATAEDLPTASFAGQQDTYLWIKGPDQVVQRVRQCWASLFTPRSISYRIKNKFPHEKVLISVGVQKMVNSKVAGVMFTLDPVNGDPSKVVIEGSWGLGETVVSGSVTPDRFVVDKVTLEINERVISHKGIECVYDPNRGEVVHSEVVPDRSDLCCLEREEVMELTRVAKLIEEHYGLPQDIEWAIDRDLPFPDNVFIVQSRPETVWSQRRRESVLGRKSGYELLMERALTPLKINF